jgi:hypothetical protein
MARNVAYYILWAIRDGGIPIVIRSLDQLLDILVMI